MSDQALFILDPGAKQGSHTLLHRSELMGPTHNLDAVSRFTYVDCTLPSPGPQFDDVHKLVNDAKPRLAKLEQFLGVGEPLFMPHALCEVTGPPNNPYIFPFTAARLGQHSQFVYARGIDHLPSSISSVSSVHFVSGPCLFGDSSLTAITDDGSRIQLTNPRLHVTKRIVDIAVDPKLSLYEMETSIRLARFIIDVVAMLPRKIPYAITIDVPQVQYYCYLLDAFEQQLIGKDLLLQWFDDVDRRHVEVVGFMQAQLLDWSSRAGLPTPEIQESPRLRAVRDYIRRVISEGASPLLPDILALLTQQDVVWRLVCETATPQTFTALNNSSYVVEELRQALHNKGEHTPLFIAVEDHYEHKIYAEAQKMLRRIRKQHPELDATMLGFYPLEPIFLANSQPASLYLEDFENNFIDESGTVYSAETLLEHIYGATLPQYDTDPERA